MDIIEFYKYNHVEEDFDEIFYANKYPECSNYYQPFCEQIGLDERHRLYHHYYFWGKQGGYLKNSKITYYRPPEEGDKEVSLVVGCMNRSKMLNISIRSWLIPSQIKEIIITDWSSTESLKYLEEIDPKIKVIRIEGKQYYNASTPVNIAIKEAKYPIILKLDVDYIINPYSDFNKLIDIDNNSFISGDFNLRDIDNDLGFVKGTNGFLCVTKDNIIKAGLYDEEIENYGREDCKMFDKLCSIGLIRKLLPFEKDKIPLYHNPHSDFYRSENFKEKDIASTGQSLALKYGLGKFHLVLNMYNEKNTERRNEILLCIADNAKNPHIKKIHIFHEGNPHQELINLINANQDKIFIARETESRPSFKSIFTYCYENIDGLCIVANNDIHFSEDISKLSGITQGHFIALTRHEHGNIKQYNNNGVFKDHIFSNDAWIFRSPSWCRWHLGINSNIKIGTIFSDPALLWNIKNRNNLLCYNVSKDVKIHHRHITTEPLSDIVTRDKSRCEKEYYEYRKLLDIKEENCQTIFLHGLNIVPIDDLYNGKNHNFFLTWGEYI